LSKRRKIVVFIDAGARSVEKELADEAYTWEEYPDAKLRAGDKLCEVATQIILSHGTNCACRDCTILDKAIAEYEGRENEYDRQ
jgi:hypothetical protein